MKPTHESEHEIYGWGIRSPTFTGSRSILLAMSRAKGSLILSTSLGRKEGKPFTETLMLPLGIAALVVDVTRSDGIPNSGREGGKYRREREIAAYRSIIYLSYQRETVHTQIRNRSYKHITRIMYKIIYHLNCLDITQ